MFRKLLAIFLTLSLLTTFFLGSPQKIYAAEDKCNIDAPSQYSAEGTKVAFIVKNISLAPDGTFKANITITYLTSTRELREQTFTFDELDNDIKQHAFNIDVSTLRAPGKVTIRVTGQNGTLHCGPKDVPIKPLGAGDKCSIDLSSLGDTDGSPWSTKSTIYFRLYNFVNLDPATGVAPNRRFKVTLCDPHTCTATAWDNHPINQSQRAFRSDFITGPSESPASKPLEYATGQRHFDANTTGEVYSIRISDEDDIWNNALCQRSFPHSISVAGNDDTDTSTGAASCQFCPPDTYVSGGDDTPQKSTNPPICQDVYGTTVGPKSGNCGVGTDNKTPQTCSPIYGCQDVTSYTSSGAPYVTPPCSTRDSDGNCTAISSGLGIQFPTDIGGFINAILGIVLSISGGITTILIIVSGYRLMVSQGNPEKIQAAREEFTAAIVGLLFVIFSLVILTVIGFNILGIIGFS